LKNIPTCWWHNQDVQIHHVCHCLQLKRLPSGFHQYFEIGRMSTAAILTGLMRRFTKGTDFLVFFRQVTKRDDSVPFRIALPQPFRPAQCRSPQPRTRLSSRMCCGQPHPESP
jgi:hypothetical protein